jgi:hypothetical protein
VRPKITRSSQPVPLADRGQRTQNVAARCSSRSAPIVGRQTQRCGAQRDAGDFAARVSHRLGPDISHMSLATIHRRRSMA